MSKYGNTKTWYTGIQFDSIAEAERYVALRIRERLGEIQDLRCQPVFTLQPTFRRGKRTLRAITYTADFAYTEDGRTTVEDVKGVATQQTILRIKMFLRLYPDITFRLVRNGRVVEYSS